MTRLLVWLRPRLSLPEVFPVLPADRLAFWAGTGFGVGLLRPAPGSWGSLVGLAYLYVWAQLPGVGTQVVVEGLALWFAVWAANRCEKLLKQKDPSSVVIDEIAPLPVAFWPLTHAHEPRWWVWTAAFCLYRAADVAKPWPACQLERLRGGVGIVADDVASSIYTGLVLLAGQHFFTGGI